MRTFNLGQVVATPAIVEAINIDVDFYEFVMKSLRRHASGDWGEMCEEDKATNDYSLENEGRLFSSYDYTEDEKIWIITEWDRSATTILFPSEY